MCILVETLSEDEDDVMQRTSDSVSVSATYGSASEFTPTPGGPFSALTPSMWPQDIMVKLGNPVRKTFYPHGIPSNKKKKGNTLYTTVFCQGCIFPLLGGKMNK